MDQLRLTSLMRYFPLPLIGLTFCLLTVEKATSQDVTPGRLASHPAGTDALLPGLRRSTPAAKPDDDNPFGTGFAAGRQRAIITAADLDCMARGINFEGQVPDYNSMLAVGTVIANRAESSRYPASWCLVLAQYRQFTSNPLNRTPEPLAYQLTSRVAHDLASGLRHPALHRVYEFRTAGTPLPDGARVVGTIGGNTFFRSR